MYTPKLFTEIKTYNRKNLIADLFAGLTVGVVALPLAMAFAIASGLPPAHGLFTAIVAGFLISVFGGSKVQIGGPTGAFVVIVSGIVAQYGYNGLAVCTLMAGGLLVLFGIFRLGGLIRFIPFPVTTGFTTGIAVVIFSTQIKDLFGLEITQVPAEFLEKWGVYFGAIKTINPAAAAIGGGTVLLILILKKICPKIPAMLLAMIAATVVSSLAGLNVETIGSRFGDLPRTLPLPALPQINWAELPSLIQPAFTVALLAAIESLLSATVADGMVGGNHRPNAELIGQGIGNIGSVLFGGIPATGAIARTATNVKCGARTPFAGIIHAITLALILLAFAPLAGRIPLASLAGILVVVSYNMSELRHFCSIFKGPRSDWLVLVLTFVLTILVDLTVAVQVGVVLSAFLFIRRMAEITNVRMITDTVRGDETPEEDPHSIALREVPAGVEVFEVNGPFFFGMIDTFKNALRNFERPVTVLVIRTRNVLAIDATALNVIHELIERCDREGTFLILSGIHSQPLLALEKSGMIEQIGRENLCGDIDASLSRAAELLQQKKSARSSTRC